MRQPGDEINADIADAGCTKTSYIVECNGTGVQSADRGAILIGGGLHAKADTVYAATDQGIEDLRRERAGSAFNGNLSGRFDLEIAAHCQKQSLQLAAAKDRRRGLA